jgi:hypothetical protein
MDTYIFRGDLNLTWQVNPMNNIKTCFLTEGPPDIRTYMPNLTGFVQEGDAVQINGQMCDSWKLVQKTLNKTRSAHVHSMQAMSCPSRAKHRPCIVPSAPVPPNTQ